MSYLGLVNVGCLDESTVAAFAGARLSPSQLGRAQVHARTCATCRASVVTAFTRSGLSRVEAVERLGPSSDGSTREALAAGTAVGRYTVLGLVGRGGMGEVYAAYDPGLDRRIALKLMSAGSPAQDGNAQERLTREARAIAKLSHPNVVIVHDVGTFEGQVFVAMEFVEGPTLAAWLVERPRGWREVLAMFVQAARGLAAAHAAGLVHRDFKPQNVLVAPDGTARVMDFGLARRIGEAETARASTGAREAPLDQALTRTGELMGTPLYMAPEQFADGRIDARTDQFSFCVALYWALCGVHPFGGSDGVELSSNVQRGVVATPGKKIAAPSRIQKALLRGLSVDPGARWPSLDALVAELLRDPRRRARNAAWAAGVAGLCGVVAFSAVQLSHRSRALCASGPERLTGIWETADRAGPGSRRESVHAAILRSGIADPGRVWERLNALLDRHVVSWLGAYRDACEATHVRSEQSPEVLDLRMACLGDDLATTGALTQLLASGDRAVIEHAGEAAGSLDDLSRCGASEQVRSTLRPPHDPRVRTAVEDARKRLKEGNALRLAGQVDRATVIADSVLARSDTGSYCPLEAETLLLKAMASMDTTRTRAVPLLERAAQIGERCGHDRVVATALGSLVFQHRVDDWAAAEWAANLDAAVLSRMGGDPVLESWLANNLGALRFEQGRFADAFAEFGRGLAIKERISGPDDVDVSISQMNTAEALVKLGRFDEARVLIEKSLETLRRWGSAETIDGANALCIEGDVFRGLRRFDAAEAAYGSSLAIQDARQVPEDNPSRRDVHRGLAAVALAKGDTARAISILEKMIAVGTSSHVLPVELAPVRFQLALALDREHRDTARSLELAHQARSAFPATPAFATDRREVEQWLDARQKPR
jgi:tetratricopeptide (TPR) repeat protein